MRILFLAPQPFFQERGTPIAVRLTIETLIKQLRKDSFDAQIDLLVYGEGQNINIEGVTLFRTCSPKMFRQIRPGISLKKLALDLFFGCKVMQMLWRARKQQYDLIHAVEESVFFALLGKILFKVPYLYDMDSSLALQLTEKWWVLKPLLPIFQLLERVCIKNSIAVAPVCDELSVIAKKYGSQHTIVLRDVSLLPKEHEVRRSLREELAISDEIPLVVYVGNLETYQGVDLLLESFARIQNHRSSPRLVIVGGHRDSITYYQEKSRNLKYDSLVTFLGPRPIAELSTILASADIVASPRIRGNNTAMKVFSYLHSGKALVATNLPTHTQVLTPEVAILAEAKPEEFAKGIVKLLDDPILRVNIGQQGRKLAERLYTIEAFEDKLLELYSGLPISRLQSVQTKSVIGI